MDCLSRVLLPTLLHELANTTQLLTGLHALITLPGGEALLARREGDLSRAGDEAQRLGFLLGVLGAASGSDTLLARREAESLEWMVSLVGKAARRAGRPLGPGPERLPRPKSSTPDAWSLAWALGAGLWSLPADGPWDLREVGDRMRFCGGSLAEEFLPEFERLGRLAWIDSDRGLAFPIELFS